MDPRDRKVQTLFISARNHNPRSGLQEQRLLAHMRENELWDWTFRRSPDTTARYIRAGTCCEGRQLGQAGVMHQPLECFHFYLYYYVIWFAVSSVEGKPRTDVMHLHPYPQGLRYKRGGVPCPSLSFCHPTGYTAR